MSHTSSGSYTLFGPVPNRLAFLASLRIVNRPGDSVMRQTLLDGTYERIYVERVCVRACMGGKVYKYNKYDAD